MTGKRIALVLLLVFVVGSVALSQTDLEGLEGLVGDVLFSYEWTAREGAIRPRVSIGYGGRSSGYQSNWEMRLLLGRDGVVFRREGEVIYFAPSHATDIELVQVDLAALDAFRARAVWRHVAERDPEAASLPNFRYTVRGRTSAVTADEVVVTPEHLVVVTSCGQWVNIFSRDVVESMTLERLPQPECRAARDLTRFESTRPFRGLKWGDPLSVLGDVYLVREQSYEGRPLLAYKKHGDDLNLGAGFLAQSIEYFFFEGKLAGIAIFISEAIDLDYAGPRLRETLQSFERAMTGPTDASGRREARSIYLTHLFQEIESGLFEEWGPLLPERYHDLVEWDTGTDAVVLAIDWEHESGHPRMILFLADASIQ